MRITRSSNGMWIVSGKCSVSDALRAIAERQLEATDVALRLLKLSQDTGHTKGRAETQRRATAALESGQRFVTAANHRAGASATERMTVAATPKTQG